MKLIRTAPKVRRTERGVVLSLSCLFFVCALWTCVVKGELRPCNCHLLCVPFGPVWKANFIHVVVTCCVCHLDLY
jgi:hypothetical protein